MCERSDQRESLDTIGCVSLSTTRWQQRYSARFHAHNLINYWNMLYYQSIRLKKKKKTLVFWWSVEAAFLQTTFCVTYIHYMNCILGGYTKWTSRHWPMYVLCVVCAAMNNKSSSESREISNTRLLCFYMRDSGTCLLWLHTSFSDCYDITVKGGG